MRRFVRGGGAMVYWSRELLEGRLGTATLSGELESMNIAGWTWMRRLWNRVLPNLVQEVPDDLAVCEFLCCEPECRVSDWESCPLRRAYQNGSPTHEVTKVRTREDVVIVNVGKHGTNRTVVNE
jgi:hypothetical protein